MQHVIVLMVILDASKEKGSDFLFSAMNELC